MYFCLVAEHALHKSSFVLCLQDQYVGEYAELSVEGSVPVHVTGYYSPEYGVGDDEDDEDDEGEDGYGVGHQPGCCPAGSAAGFLRMGPCVFTPSGHSLTVICLCIPASWSPQCASVSVDVCMMLLPQATGQTGSCPLYTATRSCDGQASTHGTVGKLQLGIPCQLTLLPFLCCSSPVMGASRHRCTVYAFLVLTR